MSEHLLRLFRGASLKSTILAFLNLSFVMSSKYVENSIADESLIAKCTSFKNPHLNQKKVSFPSYPKFFDTHENSYVQEGRNQTIERYVSKNQKHFAIVFSSCGDDIKYYSVLFKKFNCSNTDFFIYEKCLQEDVYISAIRTCLTISFTQNSDGGIGRAHEVYLRHICDSWSQLNAVNIFLKARKNPRLFAALGDLDPPEVAMVSYMNLGTSSRRAKSNYGISKVESEHFHKYLNHLLSPESQVNILNAYVSFQSNFIVSASQIYKHPLDSYEYMYNFVMKKNALTLIS